MKQICVVSILLVTLSAVYGDNVPNRTITPRRYKVDLSLPPEIRWMEILKEEKNTIDLMYLGIKKVVEVGPMQVKMMYGFLTLFADVIVEQFSYEIKQEIRSSALFTGRPIGDILFANLLYELEPYVCTSIIVQDKDGNIMHGRNLDWQMPTLRRGVILVDFVNNSQTVFSAVTWPTYVGVLTGQKPNKFTLSLNARAGNYYTTLWSIFHSRFSEKNLQGFLLRQVLEQENDFDSAGKILFNTQTDSNSYLIVGGTEANQGVVFTKDFAKKEQIRTLKTSKRGWYLVQTNDDYWEKPNDSRRATAENALDSIGQANITAETLWEALSTDPVLNQDTIFTVVMAGAQSSDWTYSHLKVRY